MTDVNAYLERINYRDSTTANLNTLRAIHRAHLLTVPFENLDIALGRKIALDEETLTRKIVERRRGGFGYELNGAFAALLRSLRFHVSLLSARVARNEGEGPEFDHLCLRVDLDEPWLVDVGFGESFLEPLRLQTKVDQSDPVGTFRIEQSGDRLQPERVEFDGDWKRQYSSRCRLAVCMSSPQCAITIRPLPSRISRRSRSALGLRATAASHCLT
jgi:N-hydroxyarylamine O-acetyltransferase